MALVGQFAVGRSVSIKKKFSNQRNLILPFYLTKIQSISFKFHIDKSDGYLHEIMYLLMMFSDLEICNLKNILVKSLKVLMKQ